MALVGGVTDIPMVSSWGLPVTPGAFSTTHSGANDAFVAAVDLNFVCGNGITLSLQGNGIVGDFSVLNSCGIPGTLYVTALTFDPTNGTNPGGG